ncbi:MAG TPA: YitT family protein [Flavisolibacter sp.]|nr:YitT family protein [Flavisolibacter sp.]
MAATSGSLVTKEQFQKVQQTVIDRLNKELPSHLTYHSVRHTKEVVEVTTHLLAAEKVRDQDHGLLLTAALFHDTGFLKDYKNHEETSCEIAREMLPQFAFSEEAIEQICTLIMVTKPPQAPTSYLGQILCDADLYYLGSANFFRESENLYKEFKAEGIVATRDEFELMQLNFLESHRYFTATAIAERGERKKQYSKQVRAHWKNNQKKSYVTDKTSAAFMDLFLMFLGVTIAGFALKGFLVPNHFFDGGVTGISLLIHELYNYNLALVIVVANLPLIAVGYYSVSKSFALKTFVCVSLLAACLLFIPYPTVTTSDHILIALFGGFFLGSGIGLCMRAGCALDGVEVLALKTFKKTPFTVTEVILAINILIFGIAAFKLGIMTALYSILTYFTASKSIDYVVEGIEAYTGVTIISGQSDLLKHRLVNELSRGITVYKGERGFLPGQFETSSDCDIIFTVVTRLELRRLKNLVHETDPKAFVFANTIREATGGILRRRAGQH